MTNQEKNTLYSVLLRLIDDDNELTQLERRDLLNTVAHACCGMTADDILSTTENNRKLLIKRGTTAQNDEYTGLAGEITMDTDTNTLRIHDGQTPGGHAVTGTVAEVPDITLPDITQIMPNYEDAQSVTLPYTANACGWLFGHIYVAKGTGKIYVNSKGIIFAGSWSDSGQNFPFTIPLRPGDTVTKDSNTVDFLMFAPSAIS